MKTKKDLLSELKWAENNAAELSESVSELATSIGNICRDLQNLEKNGPLTTTITTNDAAKIRKYLEDHRQVLYATGHTAVPVINRLIDLLPSE